MLNYSALCNNQSYQLPSIIELSICYFGIWYASNLPMPLSYYISSSYPCCNKPNQNTACAQQCDVYNSSTVYNPSVLHFFTIKQKSFTTNNKLFKIKEVHVLFLSKSLVPCLQASVKLDTSTHEPKRFPLSIAGGMCVH